MKISRLIIELTEALVEHGDLEVMANASQFSDYCSETGRVYVCAAETPESEITNVIVIEIGDESYEIKGEPFRS